MMTTKKIIMALAPFSLCFFAFLSNGRRVRQSRVSGKLGVVACAYPTKGSWLIAGCVLTVTVS